MGYSNSLTFIEKWVCCGVVDDENVVQDIRLVRKQPDCLAESCVSYTHDPVEHHVTVNPVRVVMTDNDTPQETEDATVGEEAERPNRPSGCQYTGPLQEIRAAAREILRSRDCGELGRLSGSNILSNSIAKCHWVVDAVSTVVQPTIDGDKLCVAIARKGYSCPLGDLLKKIVVLAEYGARDKTRRRAEAFKIVVFYISTIPESPDCPGDPSIPAAQQSEEVVIPDRQPSSVYRICQDVVEVKRHRRLPHTRSGDYVAAVVSEIKTRLGCPPANAANLLAVRRMANNICSNHGLRPTHAREAVELIVAGVFVPDAPDLRAAKILQSLSMASLREELEAAKPISVWSSLLHPFKGRGAKRVRDEGPSRNPYGGAAGPDESA